MSEDKLNPLEKVDVACKLNSLLYLSAIADMLNDIHKKVLGDDRKKDLETYLMEAREDWPTNISELLKEPLSGKDFLEQILRR